MDRDSKRQRKRDVLSGAKNGATPEDEETSAVNDMSCPPAHSSKTPTTLYPVVWLR